MPPAGGSLSCALRQGCLRGAPSALLLGGPGHMEAFEEPRREGILSQGLWVGPRPRATEPGDRSHVRPWAEAQGIKGLSAHMVQGRCR